MANDGRIRIGVDIDEAEFKSGLSKLGSSAKGALGAVGKAAGVALGAATAATTAFAKSAVDAGMNFDSAMSQVAATMGKTTDEIQDLRAAALDAGSTTAFSATEAAEALNYLALAGYDASTAADTLPAVLNLAAAGGMDLAYASDLATDAMSALGIEAGNANLTEFGDKMAVTASKANTSVAQLGEAILQVGATAKMLSGGTTELNAALGILADNGTKGAEGGTRLRNIILSLMAPTDTAAAEMDRLGLSVTDAADNMRPLQDILADLNSAMAGWSDEDRIKTINTIFNKTDIGDVNYLLGVSRDRWNELSTAIDNSEGAMQKMADTQLDNLEGDITMFKSALEGAQIVLSDQLTPSLREFVQFGTKSVQRLSKAFQEGGLEGLTGELGNVLSDAIAMIMDMLPTMMEAGMGLLSALGKGIIDNLPQITTAAIDIVMMLADGIISAFPAVVEAGIQMIAQLATGIAQGIPALLEQAANAVISIAQALTDPNNLSSVLEAGLQIILSLVQGISEQIPRIIEVLPQIFENIATFYTEHMPELLDLGVQIIEALVEGILNAIPAIAEALPEIIETIVKMISEYLPELLEAGVQILMALLDGLIQAIPLIVEALPQIIESIIEAIPPLLAGLIDAGASILHALIEGIVGAIPDLVGAIPQIISAIVDTLLSLIGSVVDVGRQLVGGLIDGITGAAQSSGNSGRSTTSNARSRMVRTLAVPANESSGNEGISLTADAAPLSINRAAAVRALETAIPNVQARVTTATAAMAPAAGYSMPSSIGNAYGGGESQQPAQTVQPVINIRFTGDIAQLGRILKPVIDQEDIRIGDGV